MVFGFLRSSTEEELVTDVYADEYDAARNEVGIEDLPIITSPLKRSTNGPAQATKSIAFNVAHRRSCLKRKRIAVTLDQIAEDCEPGVLLVGSRTLAIPWVTNEDLVQRLAVHLDAPASKKSERDLSWSASLVSTAKKLVFGEPEATHLDETEEEVDESHPLVQMEIAKEYINEVQTVLSQISSVIPWRNLVAMIRDSPSKREAAKQLQLLPDRDIETLLDVLIHLIDSTVDFEDRSIGKLALVNIPEHRRDVALNLYELDQAITVIQKRIQRSDLARRDKKRSNQSRVLHHKQFEQDQSKLLNLEQVRLALESAEEQVHILNALNGSTMALLKLNTGADAQEIVLQNQEAIDGVQEVNEILIQAAGQMETDEDELLKELASLTINDPIPVKQPGSEEQRNYITYGAEEKSGEVSQPSKLSSDEEKPLIA